MKRKLILTGAAFALFVLPFCLKAQTGVGIHTENPLGVFHLDGRSSSASSNPASGSTLTPAQQADDVIITETGLTGIGTASPSSRLEINTQSQTGGALRILSGSPASGKVLTSDAQGTGAWQTWTPPSTATDEVFPIITLSRQDFNINTYTKVSNGSFTVPAGGFYSAEIRWWGDFSSSSSTPFKGVFIFQLRRNDTEVIDEFICHEYNIVRVTAFTALYAKAAQGDVLSVWVNPTHGNGSYFAIGTLSGANWVLSKVLYKRLSLEDGTTYFD
jgi:hypothetical protein